MLTVTHFHHFFKTSLFELDLTCIWIGPCLFWMRSSMFRVRPSYLTSQRSSLFQSVLPTPPPKMGRPDLKNEKGFLIFRVRPSHFWGVSPSHFSSQTIPFLGSVLPTFPIQPFSFFESDLLPFFFTVSFLLFLFCVPIRSPYALLTKLKI